jgi:hypothetical protein
MALSQEQNEKEQSSIYSTLYRLGLFTSESKKHNNILNHNFDIPMSRVNSFFFGIMIEPDSIKKYHFSLHRDGFITIRDMIPYVHLSQLDRYLDEMYRIIHNINSMSRVICFPYNYFQYIATSEIVPTHYKLMIHTMKMFMNYLNMLDTMHSRNILYIMKPKLGFEGIIADVLETDETIEIIVKFKKAGSPLFIRLNNSGKEKLSLKLSFDENIDTSIHFNKLYKEICEELLMDNPKEFIVNNIERVCGSREFAELMVTSYMDKEEFVTDLDSLQSVVLWKNMNHKDKYINYFLSRYEYKTEDNNIMINFEGVNKFFLNITEDHVANFEVKEEINNMYYMAMKELISSFEMLYNCKL